MFSALFGLIATVAVATTTPQITVQSVAEPKTELTAKQEIWLGKLADCESGGREDIKILDSNSLHSYGVFQYQMATWLEQSKKYGLDYREKDIYNYQKQKLLTHLILSDGGESHWLNCHKKIGTKYPKIK